jgi:hypothetical protein
MTMQGLINQARLTRTGPPGNLSPALLNYALREVLACMLAGGTSGRGRGASTSERGCRRR